LGALHICSVHTVSTVCAISADATMEETDP
jgi:hypothetical protein